MFKQGGPPQGQVQYVQQGQQPQVQYVQQAPPQQVQYAQPKAQGGMYAQPQVQKNAGPPPPSYGAHKQQKKKNIYELADEKANVNDANKAKGGAYGGGGGASWSQPLPDAKGTCPVDPNFSEQAAIEKAKV